MSQSEPVASAPEPAAAIGSPASVLPSRRALRAAREATALAVAVPATAPAVTHTHSRHAAAPAAARAPATVAAPPRSPRAVRRQSPFTIGVAFLAIPGLLLTLALPAYSYSPGAAATQEHALGAAQDLAVSAASVSITLDRDGYTATTPEDIAAQTEASRLAAVRERSAAAVRASAAQYASSGIRDENDDYPWPDGAADGATLSPQGYYFKECVDFVAWRLNRDAGASATALTWTWQNLTPGAGSARSWSSAWSSQGRVTSDTPVVGAVAWFTYNHVAYVQSVPGDGTVVLEEYNWMGSHAYHTRVVPIGDVALYLYPPG
ncbi:CHAP domain-containing protein [Cryobacterium melibiosiphilum]|uniref:CHAP domain-containing protein n=1 Tax=Cryobacterium melibiosiphilum TaxID=995039 RepID=A0A3A5ML24_9MICO|nr:CHAP domain-containing protein [Cryobacterium melibiosiphilum]RJT86194.1 CHAP domain-containing protein [Cryobacterium melibiosiphilum]